MEHTEHRKNREEPEGYNIQPEDPIGNRGTSEDNKPHARTFRNPLEKRLSQNHKQETYKTLQEPAGSKRNSEKHRKTYQSFLAITLYRSCIGLQKTLKT